jgi:preprotein translocase subunit SecA
VVTILSKVQVQSKEEVEAIAEQRRIAEEKAMLEMKHAAANNGEQVENEEQDNTPDTFTREERKVGRNEPCPCGSGKKYKQCHGKLAS